MTGQTLRTAPAELRASAEQHLWLHVTPIATQEQFHEIAGVLETAWARPA